MTSIGNNYLILLPREIQQLLLLKIPYEITINLCKFSELSYICGDDNFWYLKAKEFGVNKSKFFHTDLRAVDKYLYFKLLTDVSDNNIVIDYLDEGLTVDGNVDFKILVPAAKNNYNNIVDYISRKYDSDSILLIFIAANDTGRSLNLISKLQPNIQIGALELAVRKGNFQIVSAIVKAYINAPTLHPNYNESILIAIKYDRFAIIKYMVSLTDFIDTEDVDNFIYEAITSDHTDVALYLLQFYKNKLKLDYNVLIEEASRQENFEIFMYLLNNFEIDLNRVLLAVTGEPPETGDTISELDSKLIKILVERGAKDVTGALSNIIQIEPDDPVVLETAKFLIKNGAKLTSRIKERLNELTVYNLEENPNGIDYLEMYKKLFKEVQK